MTRFRVIFLLGWFTSSKSNRLSKMANGRAQNLPAGLKVSVEALVDDGVVVVDPELFLYSRGVTCHMKNISNVY